MPHEQTLAPAVSSSREWFVRSSLSKPAQSRHVIDRFVNKVVTAFRQGEFPI